MHPFRTSVALVAYSSTSDVSGTYRTGVLGIRASIWMQVAGHLKEQIQHLNHVYHPYTHTPQPVLPRPSIAITIQETKFAHKAKTPKVPNFIHTPQNFKWSRYTFKKLNTSQLQTYIYIDITSKHYNTLDMDIQHCIHYITNIRHSVLTGDMNAPTRVPNIFNRYHHGV